MRLRGVSEEGENLTDLVPELKDQLAQANVELLDTNGNFRSTYDILVDLSKSWAGLTDLQRANLTELIAGKRQSDTLNAVLSNSSTLTDALTTSMDSQGSAMRENAVYMESIEAKTKAFNKAVQDLWLNAINSDTIKGVVDFGTSLVKLADSIGLVNLAIAALSSVAVVKLIPTLKTMQGAFKGMFSSMGDFKAGLSLIGSSLKSFGIGALIAGATYGIAAAVDHIDDVRKSYKSLVSEITDTSMAYAQNKDKINSLLSSLSTVKEGTDEYYSITNKLNQIMPSYIEYIDEEGNAHAKAAEYIELHNKLLQDSTSIYASLASYSLEDYKTSLSGLTKEFSDIRENLTLDMQKNILTGKGLEIENADEITALLYNWQTRVAEFSRSTKKSIAQDMTVLGQIPDEIFTSVESIVEKSISNIDVTTEKGLEKAKDVAQQKIQEISYGLSKLDFDKVWETLGNSTISTEEFNEKVELLGKILGFSGDELTYFVESLAEYKNLADEAVNSTEDYTANLEDLADKYEDAYDKIEKLQKIQKKLNDTGELTPEIYNDIASSFPDLINQMGSYESAQQAINNKVNDFRFEMAKSYTDANMSTQSFWENVLKTSQLSTSNLATLAGQSVQTFSKAESSKAQAAALAANAAAGVWSKYYGASAAEIKKQRDLIGRSIGSQGGTAAAQKAWKELNALYQVYKAVEDISFSVGDIRSPSSSGGGSSSSSQEEKNKKQKTYIDLLEQQIKKEKDALDVEIDKHEEVIDFVDKKISAQEDAIDNLDKQIDKEKELNEQIIKRIDEQISRQRELQKVIDDKIDARREELSALEKEYQEEDRLLRLEKERQKLQNIKNEKIRLYNGATGKFEWKADPRAVSEQEQIIADLEKEMAREKEKQAIQDIINKLQDQKDAIQDNIDSLQKQKEKQEELSATIVADIEKQKSLIEEKIDLLEKDKEAQEALINQIKANQDSLSDFASDIGLLDDEVQNNISSWQQLIETLDAAGIAYKDISDIMSPIQDAGQANPIDAGSPPSVGGGSSVPDNAKASNTTGLIKKGMRGENVAIVQRALTALGYGLGSIDGIFGSKTRAAVRAFQSAAGIKADGIVGDKTRNQFKVRGYDKGGGVYDTGIAMLHGAPNRPEYVYSAPNVEKIMAQVPQILANMASGDKGGMNIESMTVVTPDGNNFMRQMKNISALGRLVPRRA